MQPVYYYYYYYYCYCCCCCCCSLVCLIRAVQVATSFTRDAVVCPVGVHWQVYASASMVLLRLSRVSAGRGRCHWSTHGRELCSGNDVVIVMIIVCHHHHHWRILFSLLTSLIRAISVPKFQANTGSLAGYWKQEAQLPQRNSASAAHMEGGEGLGPPAHPLHPLWLHLCVWSNPKATTYVCQACRPLSPL